MSFLPPPHDDSRRPPQGSGGTGTTGGLRRSIGLTALGTLIPGAGLTLTRRWWLGLPLIALVVVGLLLLGWYVVRNGAIGSALDLAARPELLRALGFALVGGGLVWIGSIVMTAVTTRPYRMSGRQRAGLTTFTAAMCLAVASPTAVGLWYIDAHTDAVEKIFTGTSASSPAQPDHAGPPTGPRMEQQDPWEQMSRVNVLLLGTDAGDNREGVRTDSMIVASIDTQTGDTVLFGIPRNLQHVPIPPDNPLHQLWPQGYDCGASCLMNGIWTEAEALAQERPELYVDDPAPGLTATREVIAEVLGQPVHYTVIVNLEGFEDLVDAMGGVDIDVQERVPVGGRTFTDDEGRSSLIPGTESGWLEVGPQHLDGREALWYARSRATSDDFSRMRRQRCVVAAVVQQVNPGTMLQRYPQIVGVAGDNITVDIPQDDLPAWAELVQRVQEGRIKSLPFTIENTDVADPDYPGIRTRVYQALHPELATATATGPFTDQGASTSSPAPTPPSTAPAEPTGPTTTPPPSQASDPAPTTEPPTDELSDIGAVC